MSIFRQLSLMIAAMWLTSCASLTPSKPVIEDTSFDDFTADVMVRFESESEFRRYLKAVKRKAKQRGIWWTESSYVQLAQDCPPEECEDLIVVTGSKKSSSSSSSASITNTQNEGVDEGDIVKQFKNYLIVLQDGRLFSVDTGKNSRDLALIDRINVYQDDSFDAWYDELLIFDNLLLVTGYSYEAEATELAVFKISEDGRFSHQGTFFKSSDDYYDTDNYATRLVDDKLIIYTPIYLADINTNKAMRWPVMRKWMGNSKKGKAYSKGRNLFKARDIYYPIQRTAEPVIHSISICPLGTAAANTVLDCETEAVIGPPEAEYYVSKEAAFIWISPGWDDLDTNLDKPTCDANSLTDFKAGTPAALFKFSFSEGDAKAMFVKGKPIDQFSLESSDTAFKALLTWNSFDCENKSEKTALKYFSENLNRFSTTPRRISQNNYTSLPTINGYGLENRFTDTHLVYGGRQTQYDYARPVTASTLKRTAFAVSTDNPSNVTEIAIGHEIIRAERMGDNIVLTGHAKDSGLHISMVDLSRTPKLSDTLLIDGRYESEGRSHAFNSHVNQNNSGIMGLPTTRRVKDSARNWWRSKGSDVSFVTVDSSGNLSNAGPIRGTQDNVHEGYECEMSCIDWYGNTRPVFIEGRIFALIGTELAEGTLSNGKIYELGRVNISEPLPNIPQLSQLLTPPQSP